MHVVIGGGIAGLTAAYIMKFHLGLDVLLLERSDRIGGWIRSVSHNGAIFEMGPRSLRTLGSGAATLRLIAELGIENEILDPDDSAKNRFVYFNQSLHPLPKSIWQIIRSPLFNGIKRSLIAEIFRKKGDPLIEESLYDFISRRFNSTLADRLVDPFVSGIFAGDPKRLSVNAAFPVLKDIENQYRSLIFGSFFGSKSKKSSGSGLISFKNGMEFLPLTLEKKLGVSVRLNSEVKGILPKVDGVLIQLANDEFMAESIVFATPAQITGKLIAPFARGAADLLNGIECSTVVGCSLAFEKDYLSSRKGFGHLIPSSEGEDVLGMIYDSSVFASQNGPGASTRISVMMGGIRNKSAWSWSDKQIESIALDAVGRQLGIHASPSACFFFRANNAIPQYSLGHHQRVKKIREICENSFSIPVHLVGSWSNGIGIGDLIQSGYEIPASTFGAMIAKNQGAPYCGI
jgi:oxygen-dependent protoporphyrinogen oxidase